MELFTPTFYWILLGLSFMAAELFFPSFFFSLSLSISSFIASIFSFIEFSCDETIIIFMITTPLYFILLQAINRYYSRHSTYKSSLEENLYHEYIVIKNHTTRDTPKIIYQGIHWSIIEKDNKELHNKDRVKTLYIKGNSFVVIKTN